MRYKIELKPQGAIGRDFGMIIPLAPVGGESGGQLVNNTVTVETCATPFIDSWIVSNTSIGNIYNTDTQSGIVGGIRAVVTDGVDGEPQSVPFANRCFGGDIEIAQGCLRESDCLEWSASSASDDIVVTFGNYRGQAITDVCHRIGIFAFSNLPGTQDLIGKSFTVQASLDGVNIGPPVVFTCDPAAHESVWGGWCAVYADSGTNVPCPPGGSLSCDNLTYNATPGTCTLRIAAQGPGNLAWFSSSDLSWSFIQLTGDPVTAPTAGSDICGGNSVFTFDSSTDYTGTSFQLDATLDGNPFGDSITIQCEV